MRLIDADALFNNMEAAWWYSNNDRDEIAEKLVLDAPTVSGWTSVKDGLPEKNGRYIVFSESPICKSMLFANFAKDLQKIDRNAFYKMKRPGWYEYDSEWGYCELNYITHWMPRPDPPEGVNDNAESN